MAINVKDKLVTLESLGVAYSAEQDAREEADQALSTRIDNIVAPEGDPSLTEVSDARVSGSTTYNTLKARLDADKAAIGTDIDGLKADLGAVTTATTDDVGLALKVKTVTNGKVTAWEFGEAGGSSALESILEEFDFEAVEATVTTGWYKNDGTTGGGDTYRKALAEVTAGEYIKVTGYTSKGVSFPLLVFYNANDDFITKMYVNDGVEAKGYTDLLVTVPANAAKIGVNAFNKWNLYPPTVKRIKQIASQDAVDAVMQAVNVTTQRIEDAARRINFEQVDGTFALGFYNAVTGAWTANSGQGTLRFPVSQGDYLLVTGKATKNAGFAAIILFDANDNIVQVIDDGRYIDAAFNFADRLIYIDNAQAASAALLGVYYESSPYYPRAKKAVLKWAHKRKTGVCFGDSIFGNYGDAASIPYFVGLWTENTLVNGGFGGSRMSTHSTHYNPFSMFSLADAITTGTWTAQDETMADTSWEKPAYSSEHLAALKAVDFTKVDFITIAFGTNDWRGGKALDNANNPKDTATIAGALRYSLEAIQTTYPQIDIYVLSPIWRVVEVSGEMTGYCDDVDNGSYKLIDIYDKLKEVCAECHVRFVDDFNLGINRYNWTTYLVDGTHPTPTGIKRIAENLVKEIASLN